MSSAAQGEDASEQLLDSADIVFLDLDNVAGREDQETRNLLRNSLVSDASRAVVFITFPGRTMQHDALLQRLHERLAEEADAENVITLRTNFSVPRAVGASAYVQRQLWFTVVDQDAEPTACSQWFAKALASIPRLTGSTNSCLGS